MVEEEGSGEEGDLVLRPPRLPAGTWTVWENAWFYITQTAGYVDVRVRMRGGLRGPRPVGMGDGSAECGPIAVANDLTVRSAVDAIRRVTGLRGVVR